MIKLCAYIVGVHVHVQVTRTDVSWRLNVWEQNSINRLTGGGWRRFLSHSVDNRRRRRTEYGLCCRQIVMCVRTDGEYSGERHSYHFRFKNTRRQTPYSFRRISGIWILAPALVNQFNRVCMYVCTYLCTLGGQITPLTREKLKTWKPFNPDLGVWWGMSGVGRGGARYMGKGRGVIEGRWRINLQHSSNISYIKTDCFPFLGFGKKERERERERNWK